MVTSDSGDVLGIFKSGYQGHQYQEWLLSNVATIIDADLGIGSAGLLRNRAQAWVQVEVPDSITTPEGVEFRPNLTACTSFDGSLATTYQENIGIVVCDNTSPAPHALRMARIHKIKHSKYSGMKITDARDALAIVHSMADDFAKEVAKLCTWKVSEKRLIG
jgi:phage/plasmid-like protein (TIGR03299 family)